MFNFSTYDRLEQRVKDGDLKANEETENELSQLERKLDVKEKEIKMVMGLYANCTKLKTEVRSLKERTSRASVKTVQNKRPKGEQSVEMGLAQLLKKIQTYMTTPKRGTKH